MLFERILKALDCIELPRLHVTSDPISKFPLLKVNNDASGNEHLVRRSINTTKTIVVQLSDVSDQPTHLDERV